MWHRLKEGSAAELVWIWDNGKTEQRRANELDVASPCGKAWVEFRWVVPGHQG